MNKFNATVDTKYTYIHKSSYATSVLVKLKENIVSFVRFQERLLYTKLFSMIYWRVSNGIFFLQRGYVVQCVHNERNHCRYIHSGRNIGTEYVIEVENEFKNSIKR